MSRGKLETFKRAEPRRDQSKIIEHYSVLMGSNKEEYYIDILCVQSHTSEARGAIAYDSMSPHLSPSALLLFSLSSRTMIQTTHI